MAITTHENEKIIIRTLECDLCLRFDSLILESDELVERTSTNRLKIGSYFISHHDHVRIIYFDQNGKYLGDTISLNLVDTEMETFEPTIPIFPREAKGSTYTTIRKILSYFLKNKVSISIVGPSFAGKTSLVKYLETGIPERYRKQSRTSVTMGRSLKRFDLGQSRLLVFDSGGQRDFWDTWQDSIEESDFLIFILDGTSPKNNDSYDALNLTMQLRKPNQPILILVNKMDLYTDGYTNQFMSIGQIQSKLESQEVDNIWFLQTSIYNGICYNYKGNEEEISLINVIGEFLKISVV